MVDNHHAGHFVRVLRGVQASDAGADGEAD